MELGGINLRALKVIALFAVVCFLMAACNKGATNSNSGGNTNRPAATNANASANKSNTNAGAGAGAAGFKSATFTQKAGNLYVIQEAGLQFEVPQGWKMENEDGRLTIAPPDGSIAIIFWVFEAENIQQVLQGLGQGLQTAMDNVQSAGEPQQENHNGMTIYSQDGTGNAKGTPIEWNATIIMAPKKPVVALSTAEPGKADQHVDDMQKFIASVKPATE